MLRRFALLLLLLVPSVASAQVLVMPCNDTGATATIDATTGADGTLSSGTAADIDAAGPGGVWTGALDLGGTKSITLGTTLNVASGAELSVSVWSKLNATGSASLALLGRTTNPNYIASSTTSNLRVRFGTTTIDIGHVQTTNWTHYLITKNTSDLVRVFINGSEVGSGQTNTATFNPTHVGTALSGSINHNGLIAGLELFTSDQSANVATLYAKGSDEEEETDTSKQEVILVQ